MANSEHAALLKQGPEAWNAFRRNYPDVRPDLGDTYLPGICLRGANLRDTDLGGAILTNSDLRDADLSGANLYVSMHPDASEFDDVDKRRAADLSGADLTRALLFNASLEGADLHGANLTNANLAGATLRSAILVGASLRGCNLPWANLSLADLSEATLAEADLFQSVLRGAKLRNTDLTGAKLRSTILADVDLSTAKGLDSIRHGGPSTVGIDTIYASGGKIDESFLRGAGVPENLIRYMASLTGAAFEFYSCFISYSTKDQAFADRLYADLQAKGVRCWFAPHDIAGGKKIHEQIDEAIRLHEKVLLILSANSMSSEWVKTEIAKARRREVREKKQVLFPVALVDFQIIRDWECFDADTGKDSAREIREYFIPDFSTWTTDNEAYLTAFTQLLKGLQVGSYRATC